MSLFDAKTGKEKTNLQSTGWTHLHELKLHEWKI